MIDDAKLIQQFIETDDEEVANRILQTIIHKHHKFVFACAFKRLKNYEDAEEAASDTFRKALKRRKQLAAPERLVGWLYTIATRVAIDRLRKADPNRTEIIESLDQPPVEGDNRVSSVDSASVRAYRRTRDAEAHGTRVGMIKRLIRLLPEEDRQVMAFRYYDEFNHLEYKEIAERTGKTVKSVKNRVARATKLVRAIATQLNDLLSHLSDAEALMRRYLFDGASHEEIAELLGISPQEVADSLERVMKRWKKLIAKQKCTDPGPTQCSQSGSNS